MSYANFIPTFWSEKLQRERERDAVAISLCNRDWEGEIKNVGDTVTINGVVRPTVAQYTKNSTVITPENLNGAGTQLKIERADFFAFEVDDVDKRQAAGNIMDAQMKEANEAMSDSADDYIYTKYTDFGAEVDATGLTSATVISKITEALTKLWNNKVPKKAEVYLEVSPNFAAKMLLADILFTTPNDKIMENGFMGRLKSHLGIKVYMTTGIYNDGTNDWCVMRTKAAIAFADQLEKIEAYRPENSFSDAVKGLHLYGAKVVRPKEAVRIKTTYAAEAAI
jgi:hypothetical protein